MSTFLWIHSIRRIFRSYCRQLKSNENTIKSCSRAYIKCFHSGRKSNFGLNIACLCKQPVSNIGFSGQANVQFKGFFSLSVSVQSTVCTFDQKSKEKLLFVNLLLSNATLIPSSQRYRKWGLWSSGHLQYFYWDLCTDILLKFGLKSTFRKLLLAGCGCYFLQNQCLSTEQETPVSARYPCLDVIPAQAGLSPPPLLHLPPPAAPQRRQQQPRRLRTPL